jgi:hypothetical protein
VTPVDGLPWVTGLPAIDDVAEHVASHPHRFRGGTVGGLWLCLDEEGLLGPNIRFLRLALPGDRLVSPDAPLGAVVEERCIAFANGWLDDWQPLALTSWAASCRWLPATAEGVPVCLVEEDVVGADQDAHVTLVAYLQAARVLGQETSMGRVARAALRVLQLRDARVQETLSRARTAERERERLRAAIQSLVNALPACATCASAPATCRVTLPERPERGPEQRWESCDEHRSDGAVELPYAAELRACLAALREELVA